MKTIIQLTEELAKAGVGHGQELRVHTKGQSGHQGDVYCHSVTSKPDCWNIETTDQNSQVAVGQGEGSNHRASGPARIFWPQNIDEASKACPLAGYYVDEPEARKVCLGPIIVADDNWTLTHPKHAHHQFPAGIYLITYQLDRRTMRRVQD